MFFGLDGLDTANKSGWHRAARQTTKEILVATQKFTGVIPPVVVPDTEDHQLDVASFERSINPHDRCRRRWPVLLGLFG